MREEGDGRHISIMAFGCRRAARWARSWLAGYNIKGLANESSS